MKRYLFTCLSALFVCLTSFAGNRNLSFASDGELKIAHLTDLHFVYDRPEEAAKTFARMDNIVAEEKPDFIAITGDVIYGRPAREMLTEIVARLDSYKIPYCIVFGNHDAEQELSRAEMSAIITAGKYNVNVLNEAGELADIRIPVRSKKAALDLYLLDSHDYCSLEQVGGYAWFTNDQIQWMRENCNTATEENGGAHVPSLAFFHIPFPEFYDAWVLANEKCHNGVMGIRGEYGGHPQVNSGMYAAMLETGNIEGVFCGHDHNSDYIVPYYGIALVYGRYCGDDTVYNNLPHGVRIITVNEDEKGFRTYIHEDDGRIINNVHFLDGHLE